MDLKEIGHGIDPSKHWYYVSKLKYLIDLIKFIPPDSIVADIGSGNGFFAKSLANHFRLKAIYCVDVNYSDEKLEVVNGCNVQFCTSLPNDIILDLVLFMDVIEHVPNDTKLLDEYIKHLKNGGEAVVTVPAFDFMWSAHDIFLGHYRRYTKSSLYNSIIKSSHDVEISSSGYWFCMVFPLAIMNLILHKVSGLFIKRMFLESNLRNHCAFTNSLLSKINSFESFISCSSFPGLTVFAKLIKK